LTEKYVSGLELTDAGLDQETIDEVLGAGDFELVLHGKLGPVNQQFGTRTFRVFEAYRGMPGRVPGEDDEVYSVKSQNIQCFAAPCDTLQAKRLNHSDTTMYTGTDADLGGFLSDAWLAHEVQDNGALVAGAFRDGETYAAGSELILDASQVYLRLPVAKPDCSQVQPLCTIGTVRAYAYADDRCLVFEGCVEPGPCSQAMPSCEDGYVRVSWAGEPSACTQSACEPAWLHTDTNP